MSVLQPLPREQDAETLYWLDLAKRVLSGEISPDEAADALRAAGAREACED
jgi:hypothetical protein